MRLIAMLLAAVALICCLAMPADAQIYSQTTHYGGGYERVGTWTGPLGILGGPIVAYRPPATVTQTYQVANPTPLPPAVTPPRLGYAKVYSWTGSGWQYDGEFLDQPAVPLSRRGQVSRADARSNECRCGPDCDCTDCNCNCRR